MQEDIEQRTMSVTVQAAKLSGRVLKAAIAAALQKMEHSRNLKKVLIFRIRTMTSMPFVKSIVLC